MAENVTAVLHNIYTLRGAQVRDALNWSQYINQTLWLFGGEAEVMFASHHWPRWGNERVKEVLRDQRDMYANFNNQVLHHANQGVTINQIHNVYEMPASLQAKWHCRGYHGSPEHNSRGVVQRFLGFWDCNPATLIPLSPEESAPLYVEMMGGAAAILVRADALHQAGDYKLEVEILNKLVQAEPDNGAAKDMLADAFEQIGYQQENPGLRNSFLAAAYELRTGIPQGAAVDSSSPDVIRAMSTELFLNFLAIKMDARRAEGLSFVMNLVTPDNGERFVVELSNATLTNIQGYAAEDADLTLTLNRSDLERVMGGVATLEALLAEQRPHHEAWGHVFVTACPAHEVALVGSCPLCHEPLQPDRGSYGSCACGCPLDRIPAEPAATWEIAVSALIAGEIHPSRALLPPALAFRTPADIGSFLLFLGGSEARARTGKPGKTNLPRTPEAARAFLEPISDLLCEWPTGFSKAVGERLAAG
jgi:alkyl sulfatase BDS1-like metallo-beta-lactamase superfamily hydrolase